MRDDFGGGLRSGLEAAIQRAGAAAGGEEAGGEQIARAGRVDDLLDRCGGDLDPIAALDRRALPPLRA